jgi:hypothetical protein
MKNIIGGQRLHLALGFGHQRSDVLGWREMGSFCKMEQLVYGLGWYIELKCHFADLP